MLVEERFGGHDEPAGAAFNQYRKNRIELLLACSLKNVQRQPDRASRLLDLRDLRLGTRPCRIDENCDRAEGASSRRIPMRFAASSALMFVKPVILPPG
jgi:hypothetical protein